MLPLNTAVGCGAVFQAVSNAQIAGDPALIPFQLGELSALIATSVTKLPISIHDLKWT